MPYQKTSSNIPSNHQKPVNVFYVWYTELCRRLNSNPAPVVKPAKPKSQTILNFVADRLKVEEWNPVINALRHDTSLHVIAIKSRVGNCQFLHEVDTEEKVRQMKRKTGCLWTAFILKSLLKSLSCTVRNTQVLTCLEFDGLPMFTQYLEPLMKALQKNKTLRNLTLSRCRISDSGCQIVCAYVRFSPNIETLNLSGGGLTQESGQHLAKLIKYQQINRYCESWHNSLRYSDPNLQVMRGLKRITLNNNPLIGDSGLDFIANELDDDLWIKALDMQRCGITENMGLRLVDLVGYSQSLEIADFRLNDGLSVETIDRILHILQQKTTHCHPEYQWCNLSYTLTCDSVLETMSNYTAIKPASVYKAKSAPINQKPSRISAEKHVRKSQTSDNVTMKNRNYETERKVAELNELLMEEMAKRRESEKVNEQLKKKLDEILHVTMKSKNGETSPVETDSNPLNLLNQICKNGLNGYHKERNGFARRNGDVASSIFEKLLGKPDNNSMDEDNFLDYLEDGKNNKVKEKKPKNGCNKMTDSQMSLYKFMENLKTTNGINSGQVLNRPKTSKYYIASKPLKK